MQRPYVLTTLTLPRQRLGVSENALAFSLALGAIAYLCFDLMLGIVSWLIGHAALMVVCHFEPHIILILRARLLYKKTQRFIRGNHYGV